MVSNIRETAKSIAARDGFGGVVDGLAAGLHKEQSPQFAIADKIAGLDLSALKGSLSGEEQVAARSVGDMSRSAAPDLPG